MADSGESRRGGQGRWLVLTMLSAFAPPVGIFLALSSWAQTWALFGDYPTQAEVASAARTAVVAALITPAPLWVATRLARRRRLLVAGAVLVHLVLLVWALYVFESARPAT